jgi:hypothetical protein
MCTRGFYTAPALYLLLQCNNYNYSFIFLQALWAYLLAFLPSSVPTFSWPIWWLADWRQGLLLVPVLVQRRWQ